MTRIHPPDTLREISPSGGVVTSYLLDDAIHAIAAHIAILDRNGQIIYVNDRWQAYARDIIHQGLHFEAGSNYFENVACFGGEFAQQATQAAEGIRSVIAGAASDFEMEYPIHAEQQRGWFKMEVKKFQSTGELFVVVSQENITARKLSEIAMANEQLKLRRIYDGSSDAIMLSDSTGIFECNAKALQLFGVRDRKDFLGLPREALTPRLQNDGTESTEKFAWYSAIAAADGESRFEWLYRRTDDSVFPAEVVLNTFELDGRSVQQATVRDITIRKQNEKQLKDLNDRLQIDLEARQVAEASLRKATAYLDVYRLIVDEHAIVAETDVTGKILYANDAFCAISGYDRKELIGQNHRVLNSGVHPKTMWQEMYKSVANGGVWHGEICNRAKSGQLYWVDTTIAPLFDESGKIRGYFALRADITDLKNARKQAESSSLAKSEFLANMSHEIRTPMTAILGFADLLAEESDRTRFPKQFEYVDTIKRNGEHLLSIINDILDISKIEAEKMVVEQVETDPIKIVNDVMTLMEVKAKAKGLTLDALFLTKIPKTIQSDPTRVRQILDNLVGNAIKFTDRGGVKIEVGLDPSDPKQLAMSVIDTGIGIKPEQAGRLFGSFEQADASTTRRFGGSGLGLRICKTLAEMLGGSMTLESKDGQGSTFTARIQTNCVEGTPMVEFSHSEKPIDAPQVVPSLPNTLKLAGARILLAEDGIDNRRLISFHLKKAGAIVSFAENGKLAVEALTIDGTLEGPLMDPAPFDLIISDIQMPVMDGLTSTRMLREKGCKIPILALTAHAMSSDADKSTAAGCNAHLTKPIDQKQLISTCETWIQMYQQSQIDASQLLISEFADDPDMADLVNEYVASFDATVSEIKSSLAGRSFEQLGRLAHQLKGSGGGYGFPIISECASKLEAKVKLTDKPSDADLTTIQACVSELVQILHVAKSSLGQVEVTPAS